MGFQIIAHFSDGWGFDFLFTDSGVSLCFFIPAFAESLASENASRLASMQNAEKNIEEQMQELHVQFHRTRQMTITEELSILCLVLRLCRNRQVNVLLRKEVSYDYRLG